MGGRGGFRGPADLRDSEAADWIFVWDGVKKIYDARALCVAAGAGGAVGELLGAMNTLRCRRDRVQGGALWRIVSAELRAGRPCRGNAGFF